MKEAYLSYAMSVIVGRALPDARDGLKPVHRRVLYAMFDTGNLHNRPTRKSARIVGEVIGNINARNGMIISHESRISTEHIRAEVPLASMFGYSTSLRSVTQGRGTFSMEFAHFAMKQKQD